MAFARTNLVEVIHHKAATAVRHKRSARAGPVRGAEMAESGKNSL